MSGYVQNAFHFLEVTTHSLARSKSTNGRQTEKTYFQLAKKTRNLFPPNHKKLPSVLIALCIQAAIKGMKAQASTFVPVT